MDDLSGHTLGAYRVLERIGAGGMASVYRAYHAAMDRYVAIKVLPRHLAQNPDFHARFMREARTIARLEHRHILTVHDVAEADGLPFLVMRYTNSGDLSSLIARKSLAIPEAVRLIGQVASALAYAHRQGVIHRDIKPANVLIGPDGDALLTDFGIAKIYEDTLHLTGEGHIIGTPAYMAPEQMQGQPVDTRTDVYALGVVLYQALTGELPFVAETPLAVGLMHIHHPLRPPREINPAIPEALERIVLRAMAKSPADRFQTMDQLAAALDAALADGDNQTVRFDQTIKYPTAIPAPQAGPSTPWPAHPPAARRQLAPLWLAAGTLAVVVVLALILARPDPAPEATATAAPVAAATGAPAGAGADLRFPASSSKINDMTATADAVWAATDGGLVRWRSDGSGRVFTPADGLPFDETSSIVSAPDGTLWVGGGGVAHIRPVGDEIELINYYTRDDGLGTGVIRTLMVDGDGSIWAGGPQNSERFALSHLDGDSWRTDELPSDDPALAGVELQIQSILRSSDGSLWLGLRGGSLLRWDGERWASFGPAEGVGPAQENADVRIRRLAQGEDGTIWAAASKLGLLRFDAAQGRWQQVQVASDDVHIRAVARFADGSLWAAGNGLVVRSTDGGQTWEALSPPTSTIGNDIGTLLQDSAGQVWIGAYEGGISLLDGEQWRSFQR